LLEAKLIVEEYLDILGLHDYRQLMRDSKLKENQLSEVINLIQSLNPKPGSLIANSDIEFVIPDAVARKQNNEWVVKINPEALPRVRVNSGYADLLHHNNAPEFQTLKTQLHEARWFLKSIASRNETLLKVAKAIVTRQAEFLEQGDEFMKPLILQTVANDLQMHESTVSRITTQKYLLTPRGVFELKYFFSSHLNTEDGTECSSTAIRAMIKKFIATEDTAKPLSDKRIVDLLTEKGIHVARRTVAKYREEMAIPPSNARKSLM
jgi:RNA polymerase sigma-54 factor